MTISVIKGALIGFLSGYGINTVLAIGSLVMPRPKVSLPTTLDNCPVDVIQIVFTRFETLPNSTYIPSYDNVEYVSRKYNTSRNCIQNKMNCFSEVWVNSFTSHTYCCQPLDSRYVLSYQCWPVYA